MTEKCEECGFDIQRSPGFYLGSIYINYGITVLLTLFGYLGLFFFTEIPSQHLPTILLGFCLIFPVWFFRYARSFWLGLDYYFDPDG